MSHSVVWYNMYSIVMQYFYISNLPYDIISFFLGCVPFNRDAATSCSTPGVTSVVVRLSREYK